MDHYPDLETGNTFKEQTPLASEITHTYKA